MVCIYCSGLTNVTNSRLQKKLNRVWRRRQCASCKSVFTTLEAIDGLRAMVVRSSDGQLSPFSRDKLFVSIYESCRHRTSALTDASALVDTIISKTRELTTGATLSKQSIQEIAHRTLKQFDQAAAVQYQAYYRK